jgi:hypothetical protein
MTMRLVRKHKKNNRQQQKTSSSEARSHFGFGKKERRN